MDETYVKVAGQWRYVYRAIDQFGQVIDVYVSSLRDTKAAHRFFERAIGTTKITPAEVVTDQAPVYPAVLEDLLPAAWQRTNARWCSISSNSVARMKRSARWSNGPLRRRVSQRFVLLRPPTSGCACRSRSTASIA